jgi:transcription elongation factor Elf1
MYFYCVEKSVHCEMDRERNVGQVKCTLCAAHYETKVHALSEPIDVYSEWIDECEAEN